MKTETSSNHQEESKFVKVPIDLVNIIKDILHKYYDDDDETAPMPLQKSFIPSVLIVKVLLEARQRDKDSLIRELEELINKLRK